MKKLLLILMAVCTLVIGSVSANAEESVLPTAAQTQVQTQQNCAGINGNIIDIVRNQKCDCCKKGCKCGDCPACCNKCCCPKCDCGCNTGKPCSCSETCCPKCDCGCNTGKPCSCSETCCPKCDCGCNTGKPCSCSETCCPKCNCGCKCKHKK